MSTPERVADAYQEFFSGIGVDPVPELGDGIPAQDTDGDLVLVRNLQFRSLCEHHLLPFRGVAHIAYIPDRTLVGLGRLPRVIDVLASRPQLQERLTEQIADALCDGLAPRGVLVVMDATHGCVSMRGMRQAESSTVTIASRGDLSEPSARAEIMALIGGGGA